MQLLRHDPAHVIEYFEGISRNKIRKLARRVYTKYKDYSNCNKEKNRVPEFIDTLK
jgi:hypothetical protein